MKRGLFGMVMLTVAAASMALLSYSTAFTARYHPSKESDLGKAKCATCHVGMTKKLNPYGAALQQAMGDAKKMTPEVLAKVEGLDSDGDGVKNADEIKAGTLPGDPKSK